MKLVISLILWVCIFIFSLTYSCKHEPVGMENIDTICFSKDVLPIFLNSCALSGCHDGSNDDFNATSYQSIMAAVTPGNANKSEVYRSITNVYSEIMPPPPHKPLTREQRTIIAVWINQGATNCNTNADTSGGSNNQVDSICFTQTILPILQSSCAVSGCHDPVKKEEGYDFSSYASLMLKREAVMPFKPHESKIFKSITTNEGEDRMPPAPRDKLTGTQIEALRKWINDGALDSNCPSGNCDTLNSISFSRQILPLFQKNCTGCHGNVSPSGNVILNNYQQIKYYAENGRNNIPFLTGVLNSSAGFKNMPPYGKLDHCTIRSVELWINQGKLNN